MNTQIVPIKPETLPHVAYQGRPVLTTEQLAALYGATPKMIRDNYSYQAIRFKEGKHYIKLEGAELKAFKHYTGNFGLVPKNAPHLLLWFERGAARHAKLLETDQSWEVFEKLEDAYFNQRPAAPSESITLPMAEYAALLREVNALLKDKLKLVQGKRRIPPAGQGPLPYLSRDGEPWTAEEDAKMFELKGQGLGRARIGKALGRTEGSVSKRMARLAAKGGEQ